MTAGRTPSVPAWARWTTPVLLAVDVIAILFLVWAAFIGTDEQGNHAPAVYPPLTLLSTAATVAGSATLGRHRRRSSAPVAVVLMLVAPAVAGSAPFVFTQSH